MVEVKHNPTFYIFMRQDIPDLNPGKAMAQAAHAQADFNALINGLSEKINPSDRESFTLHAYDEWVGNINFGRTLVLGATQKNLIAIHAEVLEKIDDLDIVMFGSTIDPTYPWHNYYGQLFVSEFTTCAWLFCTEADRNRLISLNNLELHP